MDKDPFKEYMKQSEPNKRDKGYAWHTAIGLQAVDGLKTSKYLIDTAIKNIEGDISIDEAQELLNTYYEENPKADIEDRTEEADKVAVRIAKILSEKAFSFTPNEYISIHKKLFAGIYGHAGKLRDYNITKKEWVLNGATVLYGSASELRATLDYDFAEEKKFSYLGYLCDKLFVRNVIVENSLTFNPVIQLNEDRLFILQYSFFCKKVAFCNRIIYLYRQRSDSAIGETRQSSTVLDKEMTVIDAFLLMEQICRSRSETLYYVCVRKAYENILGLLCRVSSKDIEKKKRLTTILWAHCALCMKNPEYKLIDKLKLIIHSILKR